jgi:uncharacterized oxidoreductase
VQVEASQLVMAASSIFEAAGSAPKEAATIARRLVDANLAGHDSHGVIRIPEYVNAVGAGTLRPNQRARTVSDQGAVLLLDGELGYGQMLGEQAVDAGIAKARDYGIGMVTLRRSGHLGRIGDWAERAVEAGMVSLHFVNATGTQPLVVPHGGVEARGRTNPVAIGMPVAGKKPVILDFATSAVAEGKVRVARNKGTYLPPDCLLDADGKPTTDPKALYTDPRGRLMPFGGGVTGHKGSGLWLMADLLAGALSGGGAAFPPTETSRFTSNMLSIVIAPGNFLDQNDFAAEVRRYADYIRSARPRDPKKPVMLPGEPEQKSRAERLAAGITVDPETLAQIVEAGRSVGVDASRLQGVPG